MYSVNVVLIGVGQDELPEVNKVLAHLDATVEASLASASELLQDKKKSGERQCLLILQAKQPQDAEQVQQLRDSFSNWPIIALVPQDSPRNLVLAVNRAGADQIVTTPINTEDLESALELLNKRFQSPATLSNVIAVSGTVPGCGVSTIAMNLADVISHSHRMHTLLIETTQQLATQAINLNLKPQLSIADLLTDASAFDPTQIRKALIHVDARFDLLSGSPDITASSGSSIKGMPKLVHAAREIADVVVIDVAATFEDTHFETLWASDQVILVLEQTIPSIRSANMMKDALLRARPPKKLYFVINKYDPTLESFTAEKIKETLGVHRLFTIPDDRPHVLLAAADGRPLRKMDNDLAIVKSIRELASIVLGIADRQEASKSSFLNRIARFIQS
ncbi:MAG: hypothetical protein U0796_17525 [Gemmatales bacterium]